MINSKSSFLLLRLGIALSLFGHGLVRLPKLPGFSQWMTGQFSKSMLPQALVLPFSYALPIAEFVIGLLLLVGLFTRFALSAGALLMLMLIFGTTLIEDWGALPSQLIHLFFLAVLLSYLPLNSYAADLVLRSKK